MDIGNFFYGFSTQISTVWEIGNILKFIDSHSRPYMEDFRIWWCFGKWMYRFSEGFGIIFGFSWGVSQAENLNNVSFMLLFIFIISEFVLKFSIWIEMKSIAWNGRGSFSKEDIPFEPPHRCDRSIIGNTFQPEKYIFPVSNKFVKIPLHWILRGSVTLRMA